MPEKTAAVTLGVAAGTDVAGTSMVVDVENDEDEDAEEEEVVAIVVNVEPESELGAAVFTERDEADDREVIGSYEVGIAL